MPIVTDGSAADHIAVRAIGKLNKEELVAFRNDFEQLVRERGKLRILFDATDFSGWDSGGLWQEARFDVRHLSDIERLAIIGNKSWMHAMEAAVKPFVHAAMRYFDASEMRAAYDWLTKK